MIYKIIFDNGKPYEVLVNSEAELKEKLKEFYESQEDKTDYFNAEVFNEQGEDISESQFINEIVGEILGENEKINLMGFLLK